MSRLSVGQSKFLIVASTTTRRELLRRLIEQHCPDCEILEADDCTSAVDLAQKYGPQLTETILELSDCGPERHRIQRCVSNLDVRYELNNDAGLIPPLICQLLENVTQLKLLDDSQLVPISVALSEALSNSIYHGNLELDSDLRQEDESIYYELAETRKVQWPYCDRRVYVTASYSKERVKFVIRDEGPGFNVHQVADPTEDDNVCRVGGRGLLMIRAFMDVVQYNDRGNELTMVKYTSSAQALLANMTEPNLAEVLAPSTLRDE